MNTIEILEPARLARGGYKVTNDVFACPGAIAAGKAGDLCTGNGFHLCGERPLTDGGRLSGVQGCPAGFYAIAGGAWFGRNNNKNDLNCRQQNGYKAALVGCGTEAKTTLKVADTTDCFGTAYPTNVRTALVCQDQAADSPWKCNDSLNNATHTPADPAQGGVLCCRD